MILTVKTMRLLWIATTNVVGRLLTPTALKMENSIWQKKAGERYVSQLATTWGRQRAHHANLCKEMQTARRKAFEARRAKRAEAVRGLQESLGREQRESEQAMAAALGALGDEMERTPANIFAATQRALDSVSRRRLAAPFHAHRGVSSASPAHRASALTYSGRHQPRPQHRPVINLHAGTRSG